MKNAERAASVIRIIARFLFLAIRLLPFALCLLVRGAQTYQIMHDLSRFTVLRIIGWTWVSAFAVGSAVVIFRLDDNGNLKRWELLIDGGNLFMSLILGFECAQQPLDAPPYFSYIIRVIFWVTSCLLGELLVTFLVRRAEKISKRIKSRIRKSVAKLPQTTGTACFSSPTKDGLPDISLS